MKAQFRTTTTLCRTLAGYEPEVRAIILPSGLAFVQSASRVPVLIFDTTSVHLNSRRSLRGSISNSSASLVVDIWSKHRLEQPQRSVAVLSSDD